jgi:hypothetical protein
MYVKIIDSKRADNPEQLLHCDHISKKDLMDEETKADIGLEIELSPGPTIQLPRDGDIAYITNDEGKTITIYRWPRRKGDGATGVVANGGVVAADEKVMRAGVGR